MKMRRARLELDSEAQTRSCDRARRRPSTTQAAELERRWEEDEIDRLGREDTWRRELETARNERDELVEAALAERTRWTRAAAGTKHVAERAEWESERAALVSAAEAAASASGGVHARGGRAARVASKNARETERPT